MNNQRIIIKIKYDDSLTLGSLNVSAKLRTTCLNPSDDDIAENCTDYFNNLSLN
jgi:hypothetical protein